MATTTSLPASPAEDERDLGFGSRVVEQSGVRFLNRDGSFNVDRRGLSWRQTLSLYHELLALSWPRFYAVLVLAYVAINLAFAVAYLACGPGALQGGNASSDSDRFVEAFFFSVQTLATIGY